MPDDAQPGSEHDQLLDHETYLAISRQQSFIELRRRYERFAFPAAAVFMLWYVLYIVCSTWARDFMNTPVYGHINIALVFALLQFVSTFSIAWLYSRHADAQLDPLSTSIREELEEPTTR